MPVIHRAVAPPAARQTSLPRARQSSRQRGSASLAGSTNLQVRGAVALAPHPEPIQPPAPRTPKPATAASVTPLSKRRLTQPTGLRLLIAAQRASLLGASVVTAAALALYGWTVYTQQQWSKQYSQFRSLQRYEQQLVTATGALEAQILQQPGAADSSESSSQLQVVSPDAIVELAPAPLQPSLPPPPPLSQTQVVPRPIGY
ncbi:MAG: hypothetical protein AAF289_09780 [Cyanobacteria bacterium P01_A01_bin.135]